MKEPNDTTTTIVDFDQNGSISIKARRDDNDLNPSGWSIIAFAPSASIRCVRAHQERHLDLFIKSILALAGLNGQEYTTDYEATEEAIHKITSNSFR